MKKLARLFIRYPVKTLLITSLIMIVLMVGALSVKLNNGNDTLISDQTTIYQENEEYQMEFGKDPIILLFTSENPFDLKTMQLMNLLHQDIQDLDGVFAMNSPATVIGQITNKLYQETQTGLVSMSAGLSEVALQLETLSTNISSNEGLNGIDLEALSLQMQNLINAQNQLGTELFDIYSITDVMYLSINQLIVDMNVLKDEISTDPLRVDELQLINESLIDLNETKLNLEEVKLTANINSIPIQTVAVLQQMMNQFASLSSTLEQQTSAMQSLSFALHTMGLNLGNLSFNLSNVGTHFNAFEPGFPQTEVTLNMMLYDQGSLRPNFSSFSVNESTNRMVIILNGDVTDEQIDLISQIIDDRLVTEGVEDQVLVSGKPILDRSIKSSMMDSMQTMMITAVIIMIVILVFVYKVRMKLLPIFMILLVVIATIGVMGWISIGLTMVSMAVFPVLIGLGIDYFIQFQTRYEEERGVE